MENEDFSFPVLLELVKEEASKLKQIATPKELNRLSPTTLQNSYNSCVYGQMTGNCYSPRAVELIQACCSRVYLSTPYKMIPYDPILNGSPIGKKRKQSDHKVGFPEECEYYSPIEILLSRESIDDNIVRGAKIYKVIEYLKGGTDTLEL